MAKIQLGLIAAQDIGDDKLVTVQAMADLIENKARQLEHDSKNLDFGKDDEDEPMPTPKSTPISTTNQTSSTNVSSSKPSHNTSKPGKDKEAKEGKPPIKRRKKQQLAEPKPRSEDRDNDDEVSAISNRSSGGGRSRGGAATVSGGAKRQAVKRKSNTTKRTATFDKDQDSDREVDQNNVEIDPDEPTYCLCDQVCCQVM